MATNANNVDVVDDKDYDADLAALKNDSKAVEDLVSDEPEETEEVTEEAPSEDDGQTEASEESDESEDKPESTFTKQVPSIPGETPEEYYANLEKSYQHSSAEALRLLEENRKLKESPVTTGETTETATTELDPLTLYVKQKQDEEIQVAFSKISHDYPQVLDQNEYGKFVSKANVLGRVIYETENRIPSPDELYGLAVTALGWNKEDNSEKVGAAVKENASSTKTSSSVKPPSKSKVTQAEINIYKKMHGSTKSDAEIRKELEQHS